MSTENSTTVPAQDPAKVEEPVENKGKGKAVATEEPTEMSVDDDDDDSSDEEVSFKPPPPHHSFNFAIVSSLFFSRRHLKLTKLIQVGEAGMSYHMNAMRHAT